MSHGTPHDSDGQQRHYRQTVNDQLATVNLFRLELHAPAPVSVPT
jgi:hypothetical protein